MAADERRRKILEALSVRRYETCDNLAFEFRRKRADDLQRSAAPVERIPDLHVAGP